MYSIIGSLLYTGATQLVTYPILSRYVTDYEYGVLLVQMGVVNAIAVSLGNSLNNCRILLDKRYNEEKITGDFNRIYAGISIIQILLVICVLMFIVKSSAIEIGWSIGIALCVSFRSYHSVAYRTRINYKLYLMSNFAALVGYLIGTIIAVRIRVWQVAFFFGEAVSCVYIAFTAYTVWEPWACTKQFGATLRKYLLLAGAAVLSQLMLYLDRFFIYPVLGADSVSVFNISSFLGKTAGIIILPITGVILSYIAKQDKMSLREYFSQSFVFFAAVVIFYVGILLFGYPVIEILFPTLAMQARPYYALANLGSCLSVLGSTLQPASLKHCHSRWQVIIQSTYLLAYFLLGISLMRSCGLWGFCIAVILSNVVRIVMLFIVTLHSLKKENNYGDSKQ